MPQAFSTGRLVAEMNSPQSLRRGNSDRSTSAISHPACAKSRAAADPAGPAPTTIASNIATRLENMAERKGRTLVQGPAPVLWPMLGQVLRRKTGLHAYHGVVP